MADKKDYTYGYPSPFAPSDVRRQKNMDYNTFKGCIESGLEKTQWCCIKKEEE